VTRTVQRGDRVRLAYVGRFEDGTVFATSDPALAAEHGLTSPDAGERAETNRRGETEESASTSSPLSFVVGAGEVIEGLEEGIVGVEEGTETTIRVPPEDAYGPHDPDRVREYDPETFEAMVGQPPEIGLHVEAQNGLHGDVTAVSDTVQVDFNHELAGKTLVFEVELLSVS
jgi:peptidyl-prolyl cis-trans isomerase B (cyclophilin B)